MTVLPVPVRVPVVVLPLATPSTVQLTVVVEVPVTAAVRDRVPALAKVVAPGVRVTWTGAWTVMTEEPEPLSMAEVVAVAVRVWEPAAAGAL